MCGLQYPNSSVLASHPWFANSNSVYPTMGLRLPLRYNRSWLYPIPRSFCNEFWLFTLGATIFNESLEKWGSSSIRRRKAVENEERRGREDDRAGERSKKVCLAVRDVYKMKGGEKKSSRQGQCVCVSFRVVPLECHEYPLLVALAERSLGDIHSKGWIEKNWTRPPYLPSRVPSKVLRVFHNPVLLAFVLHVWCAYRFYGLRPTLNNSMAFSFLKHNMDKFCPNAIEEFRFYLFINYWEILNLRT